MNSDLAPDIVLLAGGNDMVALRQALDAKADPNQVKHFYVVTVSAVVFALFNKKLVAFDMLLAAGADPNQDFLTEPLVLKLSREGNVDGLRILLDYEPDLHALIKTIPPKSILDAAKAVGNSEIVALLDQYEAAPKLEEGANITKRMLLYPNKAGLCRLDHPATWKQLPTILEALEARGEHFSKQDLLKLSKDGRSFLQRGIECNQMPLLMEHLHAHGESLRSEELLTPARTPTALLEIIMRKQQVGLLFQEANWLGGSMGDVRKIHRALPQEHQDQVYNLHQLTANIGRHVNVPHAAYSKG